MNKVEKKNMKLNINPVLPVKNKTDKNIKKKRPDLKHNKSEVYGEILADVQSRPDMREIDIDKVGVSDLSYPVCVLDRNNGKQNTIAMLSMYVDLPRHFRGTHMSRFVEILNEYRGLITMHNIDKILKRMIKKFDATSAHFQMSFDYFIEKSAPVSKVKSFMNYKCEFISSYSPDSGYDFVLGVKTPVNTLCPCSKEISESGAHNQRGIIDIHVRFKKLAWIEDIVMIAEKSASSPVFSLLKRPDEKYVTELSYENPRFVEDVVRESAFALMRDDNITWFTVEAENYESIHAHNAYAIIKRDKRK